ncbi:MAG: hypothetical protein Q7U57_12900 [Methylovulum sp.]|nr:hypothetical protein [Methylovulum sp.]
MLYDRTHHSSAREAQAFVPDHRLVQMLYAGLDTTQHTQSFHDNADVMPMLAKDADLHEITGPVLVQPKLDGIRAIWNPKTQQLQTRAGNVIRSCDHIITAIREQQLQHLCLDGEIFTPELPFQTINGLVRNQSTGADTLKLPYHIFDQINVHLTADKRAQWLAGIMPSASIKPVSTFYATPETIGDYYQGFLDSGCEGLIIRDPGAYYQPGKSAALLRVKPVKDMEAILVGFKKTASKRNRDSFGALVLKLPSGKTFNCSGIKDDQRKRLWHKKPIGESVTFFYQGFTEDGIPRFPRFKAIRHDMHG